MFGADAFRQNLERGLSVGRQLIDEAGQEARRIEEDFKARRETDVAGMVAGLRARLSERLQLEELPLDADLAYRQLKFGGLGLGHVRTSAWREARLRKIVLSHISVSGVIDGLALTLLPTTNFDFPCFVADFMVLPWRLSVNADVYGRDWQTRESLLSVRSTFQRMSSGSGALWAAKMSSGRGLHAKLRPRQVEEGFAALTQGVAAYLEELSDAPPGRSTEAQEQFFYTFHQNGPRTGVLKRLFGEPWAERYSRLLFE